LRVGVRVAWVDSSGSTPQTGVIMPFDALYARFPALRDTLLIGITAVLPDGAPNPIPVTSAALYLPA
jgi:hypothetical protein